MISVNIFWLLLFLTNTVILYLSIRWYKEEKTNETKIAVIVSIINIVTIIGNIYNEYSQKIELKMILENQTATLIQRIDSLNKKNIILVRKSDSLQKIIIQSGVALVSGNNNNTASGIGNIAGNQNTVISGNDRSTIIISPEEKPIIDDRINVSQHIKTQVYIKKGDKVLVTATGTINTGANVGPSGPEGKISGGLFGFPLNQYNVVSEYPHAALMLRYTKNDSWINCGREYSFTSEKNGFLEFEVNDIEKNNNKGSYQVDIKVYR